MRKAALLKQHSLTLELVVPHPCIKLVELDRQDQVLAALAEGAADVALGNVRVVKQLIERRFGGLLRITDTVAGEDSELYFGVLLVPGRCAAWGRCSKARLRTNKHWPSRFNCSSCR